MKARVLLILGIVFFISAQQPDRYEKNDHVRHSSWQEDGRHQVWFAYRDHNDNGRVFKASYDVEKTNEAIEKFGVETEYWESIKGVEFRATGRTQAEADVEVKRQKERFYAEASFILAERLMELDSNRVVPLYSEMVQHYMDFCHPIAIHIAEVLDSEKQNTRQNRIDVAMRFVQDIPYGVPPPRRGNKETLGILTPPEILLLGYGDCDSKAILFAGIIQYLLPGEEIFFLASVKDQHLAVFIRDPESIAQVYVEHEGTRYGLAEVAGPGRIDFGKTTESIGESDVYVVKPNLI